MTLVGKKGVKRSLIKNMTCVGMKKKECKGVEGHDLGRKAK